MYEGLTASEAEIAKRYESMTADELDAEERWARENGKSVQGPVSIEEAANILSDRKRMVSMRLPPAVIEGLKAKAERVGIPYQTLAASVLKRYVEGKLDIEAA